MDRELLQNAVNHLLAEGLIEEGCELDNLLTNMKVRTGRPVCPHCQEEMLESRYEGYYDEFDMWSCGCDEFPKGIDKEIGSGSYA